MPPTTTDLSWRRRLIYHGLRRLLPEATAVTAVRLCESEFRHEAEFSFAKFLNRLSELDRTVADKQIELHGILSQLKERTRDELGPDPIEWLQPAGKPLLPGLRARIAPTTMLNDPGWAETFNRLLNALIASLNQIAPAAAARALECLNHGLPGLKPTTLMHLDEFVRYGTANFTNETNKTEMQAIFHSIYLWLCEEYGPVTADRLCQRAIRTTESEPNSLNYPPRALL